MTVSGKIEKIYFGAKALFIVPLAAWMFIYGEIAHLTQFALIISAYIITNLILYWMLSRKVLKGNVAYFPVTLLDAVFVYYISSYYGSGSDSFYVLFYYLIGMLALFRPLKRVLVLAIAFTAAIIVISIPPTNDLSIFDIAIRCFYVWLVGGIGFLISHYITTSEKKLLRTLDILNERTWELESSQAMLENMYETTLMLSSILDLNQLLNEILNVARNVLRVPNCSILLAGSQSNNLYIYAKLDGRQKIIFNPPKVVAGKTLSSLTSHMAASYNEKLIIGQDSSKKLLELPLISHGKVLGLLQIEPPGNHPVTDKDRKNYTILASSTAIAIDNALLHMKMQELTIIDELTGLYNYRYFKTKLNDEVRRADRYHQPLSVLMIDVDYFKKINDSQGHQTGNIILQEIVSIIKNSVRDVDIVARYGGEEFIVLLPQTEIKYAISIAERMRIHVERSYFTNAQGQREIKATISIGAAFYPGCANSAEQLIIKVDKAMYYAKETGRNRVNTMTNTPESPISINNE